MPKATKTIEGASQRSAEAPPRAGICVLAPALICTVTIESFGEREEIHFHAGGQGLWIARMAGALGQRVELCAPIGGESGRLLESLIHSENVTLHPTRVSGANGSYVHDRRDGNRREIAEVAGAALSRHETDDLCNAVLMRGLQSSATVLTGTVDPRRFEPDALRRLALNLGNNGTPVVVDASGAFLTALAGGVEFLKVAHGELLEAGLASASSEAAIIAALRSLTAERARNAIVSRAGDPALAMVGGRLYRIVAPQLEETDHRGAGDSMTAALAVALARGIETEAMLKLAGACGALNVTRHGLGTGRREWIESMVQHVRVEAVV